MENWERELNDRFGKSRRTKEITGVEIHRFIKNVLKNERKRDKFQEIIDYIKKHNSKTDMLARYVMENVNICEIIDPSQKLMDRLGIEIHESEARILYILEKHFNQPTE